MIREPVQQALELDTVIGDAEVTYTLHFPYLPPSKNEVNNWPPQWRNSAKKKWIEAIRHRCVEQGIPLGCRHMGLAARLVFPRRQRRDVQNYAQSLWDWVPDGLVRCGVLVDDNDGRLHFPPNLGITIAIDDRRHIPERLRKRTTIVLAVERAIPRGHVPDDPTPIP